MNNHGGYLPNQGAGAVLPFEASGRLPAHTGLTDVAFGRPAKSDSRFDINEIWRIVAKWWWLITGIAVACLLAAIVISLMITPLYRAQATIEVNPEGVQVVGKEIGEVQPTAGNDRAFLNTQVGLLKSRSLAERVARSTNLANNEAIFDQDVPRQAREGAAAGLVQGSVTIAPQRDSSLIGIAIESANPELAARLANAYADSFIQSNMERRYEATSYARNFLQQRIAAVKSKLEQSERQLVAYAKQMGILTLSVDTGGTGSVRQEQSIDAATLIQTNNALSAAKSDRIAAEQRYRQSAGAQSQAAAISDPTVQGLGQQRAALEAQYQQKLALYKADFPEMVQLRNQIDSLSKEIARQSSSVSGSTSNNLRADYQAALARENALQAKVNEGKAGLMALRERSIQYTILQREVDTNRSLYDALLQRFKEVGVAGGVGANVVSVVDRAQVPGGPFKPNLPLNIMIGLCIGLLLGLGTAFSIEWIDDTIKTPDDLGSKLGLSSLGVIPGVGKGLAVRDQLEDPRSQVSEAYQSVRTALQFSTDHGVPRSLLVTSTRASEGKSSTALALAQTLASLGASVLLIDADLRKPTFRGPTSTSQGLSSLLAGSDKVAECVHPTQMERLFLLPSGPIPPNPAELLASGRFKEILDEALQRFDHIIIDSPPVLGLADAPMLASSTEGTLMVIEAGAIRRAAALNAVNRLRASDARLMGAILTKFNALKVGYGYGYGYGYGEDAYAYREGDSPKKQIELLKG
ncbi:MAG: polysaccharide biosynthesis transport protein [Sphingomonadales bacterium]|jgi:capsular exopolysaccharide synthesis family protein|nr:polysaccharide biosynthesis transport protein [Sphingomonadales bacterium]